MLHSQHTGGMSMILVTSVQQYARLYRRWYVCMIQVWIKTDCTGNAWALVEVLVVKTRSLSPSREYLVTIRIFQSLPSLEIQFRNFPGLRMMYDLHMFYHFIISGVCALFSFSSSMINYSSVHHRVWMSHTYCNITQ